MRKRYFSFTDRLSLVQWVGLVVALILVFVVSERLISQGTFLGYNVRQSGIQDDVASRLSKQKAELAKSSFACNALDSNSVQNVFNQKFEQAAVIGDISDPFFSSCSYINTDSSSSGVQSINISIQDKTTQEEADEFVTASAERSNSRQVEGRQGFLYSDANNQLIKAIDRRVYILSMYSGGDSDQEEELLLQLFDSIKT